jgi:hypothetical protein
MTRLSTSVPLRTLEMARSGASTGTLALRLGSDTEQARNQVSLAECVAFCQPPDSSLVDHVHGFDFLQRPPRTLKRAVSFREPLPLFHRSPVHLNLQRRFVLRVLERRKKGLAIIACRMPAASWATPLKVSTIVNCSRHPDGDKIAPNVREYLALTHFSASREPRPRRKFRNNRETRVYWYRSTFVSYPALDPEVRCESQ